MTSDRVLIGRVIKPHGIRGEVAVDVLTDFPERLAPGSRIWLRGELAEIEASRPHQGRLLVKFADVADRNAAELLRRAELTAEPIDAEELDTYLVSELIGMAVRLDDGTAAGRDLGTVSAVIDLPDAAAYDLLEVRRSDGSTWLLPAVDEYVEVDEDADGNDYLVVVDPPDGLLE